MTQKNQQTQNLSSFIWNVADDLWGDFKHTDFGRIILPFLLLRRLECVLEDTKNDVIEQYEANRDSGLDLDLILPTVSGYRFYNTSRYSLESLGPSSTKDNLMEYISGFSSNVSNIFEEFGFANTVEELDRARLLYRLANQFASIDLHTDSVSDRVMSDIYEDLIRKFAASVNEKAGEFMTPRDVVRLATKIVIATDEDVLEDGSIRSIYDPTCGTLGFLSDGLEQIRELSPGGSTRLQPYGQELDPKTHAIAQTAMLLSNHDPRNIAQGSTLSSDQHADKKFHYGLANPPFGIKWAKDQAAVLSEHHTLGFDGRFGPGLPRVSDSSMLFLLHLVDKMEAPEHGGGRVGIVLSGSPLFTGDAGSGESEIRRWLLENDFVEAIIALPTGLFYNTGIGTYLWILSNRKDEDRQGYVQLIDATEIWTPMRKSQGDKRRMISEEQARDITKLYHDFKSSKISKIFHYTEFGYRKIAVKQPLRAKLVITEEGIRTLAEHKAMAKLDDSQREQWLDLLRQHQGDQDYEFAADVVKQYSGEAAYGKVTASFTKALRDTFMVKDEEGEVVYDNKGQVVPDKDLNDTENVPLSQSVEDYFANEVTPHVPDAFIDHSVRDNLDGEVGTVGYEINFNRYFYEYVPPRPLSVIDDELRAIEAEIQEILEEVAK